MFDAKTYWEKRLSKACDLSHVGYIGKGPSWNQWMYRHRQWHLSRTLNINGIVPENRRILDVGLGSGFYVSYWLRRDAEVVASDFTESSVSHLRIIFPSVDVLRMDISEALPDGIGQFDIVSAFDVLFHIVDPDAFSRALLNISALLHPGGWLIASDNFVESSSVHAHCAWHTISDYQSVLSPRQFEKYVVRPIFFTLNNPSSIRNEMLRTAAVHAWEAVTRSARLPVWGPILASGLSLIDRVVIPHIRRGPSTSLLLARKNS